jgi:hypothetical protein
MTFGYGRPVEELRRIHTPAVSLGAILDFDIVEESMFSDCSLDLNFALACALHSIADPVLPNLISDHMVAARPRDPHLGQGGLRRADHSQPSWKYTQDYYSLERSEPPLCVHGGRVARSF